jgi:membrane-associated protein
MRGLVESAARMGTLVLVALALGLGFGEGAIGLDLVVPGEVGMVFVGAAAAESGTPVVLVIAAGAIGAVAGDSVGWLIGRRYGVRVITHWRPFRRLMPSVERARSYFERRGGTAVFAARWVGALRGVVPLVAGTAEMRYLRFLAWDAPAAILWTTAVVLLGYHVGDDVADLVDRVGLVASLGVAAVVAAVLLVRHQRGRRHAAASSVPS